MLKHHWAALVWLLALAGCQPANQGADAGTSDDGGEPLVAADPVWCESREPAFWARGDTSQYPDERELTAIDEQVAGEVTLHFGDGYRVGFAIGPVAPPLLPELGPVHFLHYSGDCWGEGCDPTYVALESNPLGRFLEFGSLNFLDDFAPPFGSDLLSIRRGTASDRCPRGGGEVPGVLRLTGEDSIIDLLPGQAAEVLFEGARWHGRADSSVRTELIQSNDECDDCASPGRHSETRIAAIAYRALPL